MWEKDVEEPARAAGAKPPKLLLLSANYRLLHEPLLKLIEELEDEFVGRTIAVLLPEVVKTRWWQSLLHTHRARQLHAKLLQFGGSNLVVMSMPWYLDEPKIDDAIIDEPLEVTVA